MPTFHIPHDKVKAVAMDSGVSVENLARLGVAFDEDALNSLRTFVSKYAMDEAPSAVTTPSTATALQFLQYFYKDPIMTVTQARVADELMGRSFAGSWADEEIVIPIVERVGQARLYGDHSNVKFASFNNNFERRNIVRFELGCETTKLSAERSAKMRLDLTALNRSAVAEALAIIANDVAFNGFNGGNGHTYGILNDPGLPSYVTVSTGASGSTTWASKTFAEICADIRTAVQGLRVRSGFHFTPERDAFTLGLAGACSEALNYTTEYGVSIRDFISKNYPKCRIVIVPQFSSANGAANVMYLIADSIGGKKVLENTVQDEFRLIGAMPSIKGFQEDYINAMSGVVVEQPIGVVRYSGI